MRIFKITLFWLIFLFNLYFIKSNLISDNYLEKYFNKNFIKKIKKSVNFNGFLLEFEYNNAENCYKNKNHKDEYDLEIRLVNGNYVKKFTDRTNNTDFKEIHKYFREESEHCEDECGHLFKIKVNDPDEKIYIVYLSFNNTIFSGGIHYNTFKKEKTIEKTIGGKKVSIDIDEKLIEFESICCFEFIRYNVFFKNCVNLRKVILKNRKKNETKNENDFKTTQHSCGAFEGCKNLKEVDLSEFFLLYDQGYGFSNMFSDCEQIENLILNNPEDNTFFSESFNNCKNIKSITFVNKNKDIIVGEKCFSNCNNLENLNNIENKIYLKNKCNECFKNCKKITNLKLNIDETKFCSIYFDTKEYSQRKDLTEEQKREYDINKCIDFKNTLTGTEIKNLEITTADNIDLNIFASHIETLVKSGKVENFTFNGVTIKVSECPDLKTFINNPEKYLEEMKEKEKEKLQKIENTSIPNETKIDENNKNHLSCFKLCCCCKK